MVIEITLGASIRILNYTNVRRWPKLHILTTSHACTKMQKFMHSSNLRNVTGYEAISAWEGKECSVLPGRWDGGVHVDHGQGAQGSTDARDGRRRTREATLWAVSAPRSVAITKIPSQCPFHIQSIFLLMKKNYSRARAWWHYPSFIPLLTSFHAKKIGVEGAKITHSID